MSRDEKDQRGSHTHCVNRAGPLMNTEINLVTSGRFVINDVCC